MRSRKNTYRFQNEKYMTINHSLFSTISSFFRLYDDTVRYLHARGVP
jgi:hypothetical protein